jgi:hypothetical protein
VEGATPKNRQRNARTRETIAARMSRERRTRGTNETTEGKTKDK